MCTINNNRSDQNMLVVFTIKGMADFPDLNLEESMRKSSRVQSNSGNLLPTAVLKILDESLYKV
eukprot:gene72-3468_t